MIYPKRRTCGVRQPTTVILSTFCASMLCISGATAAIRTVALSGQRAPIEGATLVFESLHDNLNPVINDVGTVAFTAIVSEDGLMKESVWIEEQRTLRVIARTGNRAPGATAGRSFAYFDTVNVNELGSVLFGATLNDQNGEPNFRDEGIWMAKGHSLLKIANPGDQIPGHDTGIVFENPIRARTLNNLDQTTFRDDGRAFVGSADSLQLIPRGGQAPGLGADVRLGNVGNPHYPLAILNDSGQFAFRSMLSGPAINANNDGSVWFWNGTDLHLIALDGDLAPGAEQGEVFHLLELSTGLHEMAINNFGHVAFFAAIRTSSQNAGSGVWLWDSNDLTLLAKSFDVAPDTGGGAMFAVVGLNVLLNGSDQAVFTSTLVGPEVSAANDSGLWTGEPGRLRLVAREGDLAPGAEPGQLFGDMRFTKPSINSRGQVAFAATIIDPEFSGPNMYGVDAGIWAETGDGMLTLIVRDGDAIEVAPGDVRTVLYVNEDFNNGSGNEDGLRSFFNNRGELVFSVTFTDGSSGIFVSNAVAISEPSTFFLYSGVLATIGMCRGLRQTTATSSRELAAIVT
jgi:hypothetical protein